MLTPKETHLAHTIMTEMMGYGFQFLIENARDELIYIQKDGVNAGVSCLINYYPAVDVTTIILANQATDVWDLSWEIQELFIGTF